MHRMTSCAWVGAAVAVLIGCGEDAASGSLAVSVVDEDGPPLAGAEISGAGGAVLGTTAADGTAELQLDGDAAEVALVVRASGFAPHVFVGPSSGERRIALEHVGATGGVEVRGTIPGWDVLPAPAAGRYYLATVQRSRTPHEILMDGPTSPDVRYQRASDTCLRTAAAPAPCAWEVQARPGRIAVVATALEMEGDGATPEDDVVIGPVAAFVAASVDVVAGGVEGIELEEATVAMLGAALPPAEGLFAEVVGVPGVGMDGGARAVLFPAGVIALAEGPLAGGTPWLVVDGYNDGHLVSSTVQLRDVDPSGTVSVGRDQLPAPPDATVEGEVVTFAGARSGPRFLRAYDFAGATAWTAWIESDAAFDASAFGLELAAGGQIAMGEAAPASAQTPSEGRAAGRRVVDVPE
jgi:hypothetical protein